MAARRIGSASPGGERVSATFRTPQGSACCEPVFRHSLQSSICFGPFFAIRTPEASVCCERVRLFCLRAEIWRFFAPGLIAAKPVKPCDRAVFRAFYWLLFLQRNGRWRRGKRTLNRQRCLRGGLAAHRRAASLFPQPSARRKAALAANRFSPTRCNPAFAAGRFSPPVRRKPAFAAGGFGCFARVLESGVFSLLT